MLRIIRSRDVLETSDLWLVDFAHISGAVAEHSRLRIWVPSVVNEHNRSSHIETP